MASAANLSLVDQINAANEARAKEAARAYRLKVGTEFINKVFDGVKNPTTGVVAGGIQPAFYDKFRKANLDFYLPEVNRQYEKGRDELTFGHARAGTLYSSMKNQNLADLLYQNDLQKAQVRSKADTATADLKKSVLAQKQSVINQLYATENPEISNNMALNSVSQLKSSTPEFSPLGDMFKLAAIGGGNFLSAYNDPYNKLGTPGGGSSGRNIG